MPFDSYLQAGSLVRELKVLPLHTLLTAAFITYLPSKPEDARAASMQRWMSFLGVSSFDVSRFMSSESEMLTWKGKGLPADDLSVQNAIVIMNSQLSPLIIDPSTQASDW